MSELSCQSHSYTLKVFDLQQFHYVFIYSTYLTYITYYNNIQVPLLERVGWETLENYTPDFPHVVLADLQSEQTRYCMSKR